MAKSSTNNFRRPRNLPACPDRHTGTRKQASGSGQNQASGSGQSQTSGSGRKQASGSSRNQTSGSSLNQTSGSGLNQTSGSGQNQTSGSGRKQTQSAVTDKTRILGPVVQPTRSKGHLSLQILLNLTGGRCTLFECGKKVPCKNIVGSGWLSVSANVW